MSLRKLPYTTFLIDSPVYSSPGSRTSRIFEKNSKSFLDVPIGTRRCCLKKKTGDQKSRDTVPLMLVFYFVSENINVDILHVDVCHLFSSIKPSYFNISSFSFSRSRFLLLTFSLFSFHAMEKTLVCTVCVYVYVSYMLVIFPVYIQYVS